MEWRLTTDMEWRLTLLTWNGDLLLTWNGDSRLTLAEARVIPFVDRIRSSGEASFLGGLAELNSLRSSSIWSMVFSRDRTPLPASASTFFTVFSKLDTLATMVYVCVCVHVYVCVCVHVYVCVCVHCTCVCVYVCVYSLHRN